MSTQKLILIGSNVPIVIAAIMAAVYYARLGTALQRFALFLFLSVVVQCLGVALWLSGVNNMPLLHLYVLAGFLGLLYFYASVFYQYINARILWVVAGGYLLFVVVDTLFFEPIMTYNTVANVVEAALVIILALAAYQLLLQPAVRTAKGHELGGLLWVNSGLFIYYASTLLLFYFGDLLMALSVQASQYSWLYHAFFTVLMYSCIIIGLWKQASRLTS